MKDLMKRDGLAEAESKSRCSKLIIDTTVKDRGEH